MAVDVSVTDTRNSLYASFSADRDAAMRIDGNGHVSGVGWSLFESIHETPSKKRKKTQGDTGMCAIGIDRRRSRTDTEIVAADSLFDEASNADDPRWRPSSARMLTVHEQLCRVQNALDALRLFVRGRFATSTDGGQVDLPAHDFAIALSRVDRKCECLILSLSYWLKTLSPGEGNKIVQKQQVPSMSGLSVRWWFFSCNQALAETYEERTGVPASHWMYGEQGDRGGTTWRENLLKAKNIKPTKSAGRQQTSEAVRQPNQRFMVMADIKSAMFAPLDKYASKDNVSGATASATANRQILHDAALHVARAGGALRGALGCVQTAEWERSKYTDTHGTAYARRWGLPRPQQEPAVVYVADPHAPQLQRAGSATDVTAEYEVYCAAIERFIALFDGSGAVAMALADLECAEDIFTPHLRTLAGPAPPPMVRDVSPVVAAHPYVVRGCASACVPHVGRWSNMEWNGSEYTPRVQPPGTQPNAALPAYPDDGQSEASRFDE